MRTFHPHPLLTSGHAQTVAAMVTPTQHERARLHFVSLPDGDRIVLHDDRPAQWRDGDRTALLVHGLCGSHRSGYLRRVSARLNRAGLRTFRLDLRGCGAGTGLARHPYHSGRSEDVAAALIEVARICPAAPTTLIAFSLGANIALKLLGECGAAPPGNLDRAVAVSPPIDLAACVAALARFPNHFYDRYFAGLLFRQVSASAVWADDAQRIFRGTPPRRLLDFDDRFTAPLSGFGDAATYYRKCSAAQFMPAIRMPTTILIARDDPVVSWQPFATLAPSSSTTVHITDHGGHLGFIGRGDGDPDRRWMDWRVVEWAGA